MQAGAADYVVKTELQTNSLERSVRYALQRKRAAVLAAFEQARLAAFGAENWPGADPPRFVRGHPGALRQSDGPILECDPGADLNLRPRQERL